MTAAEIAELLGAAALDGLALAQADRARQALAARAARAAQPLRAPPSRRARARRHQAARSHLGARRRPPRARTPRSQYKRRVARAQARRHRLRVRARDGRRPLAPGLRRGARRSHRALRVAFLRRAVAWFAERGVQVRAVMTDNGSCYSPTRTARPRRARPAPPAHQARPAAHERQGRALHPDAPQRVGLRPHLRQLGRTHRRPPALPRALQLQTTTRLPRQKPPAIKAEQPRWELQLGVA